MKLFKKKKSGKTINFNFGQGYRTQNTSTAMDAIKVDPQALKKAGLNQKQVNRAVRRQQRYGKKLINLDRYVAGEKGRTIRSIGASVGQALTPVATGTATSVALAKNNSLVDSVTRVTKNPTSADQTTDQKDEENARWSD